MVVSLKIYPVKTYLFLTKDLTVRSSRFILKIRGSMLEYGLGALVQDKKTNRISAPGSAGFDK